MRSYRNQKPKRATEDHWWERFAVMVSAFALCVSVIATAISVWQTFLIQEQVNASDRNRSYEAIIRKSEDLCAVLTPGSPALATRKFSPDATKLVLVIDRDSLNPAIFTPELRRPIRQAFRDLDTALVTAKIWATGPQQETFDQASQWLRRLFYSFDGEFRSDTEYFRDQFTSAFALAAYVCNDHYEWNVRSFLASWLSTGTWPDEANWIGRTNGKGALAVVLSKTEINSMNDEQIIAKAIEQTDMPIPD